MAGGESQLVAPRNAAKVQGTQVQAAQVADFAMAK